MSVLTRDISGFFEHWAPNATKMDYDNTGLLVGNPNQPVSRILCCLDVTPEVIDEAANAKADLIAAHHPLIFPKIKRVVSSDLAGAMIQDLIRRDIGLIAAHTNLDAAKSGVSAVLAETLGLTDLSFLDASYKTMKLVIVRLPVRLRDKAETYLKGQSLDCSWSQQEENIAVVRFNADEHHLVSLKRELGRIFGSAPYTIDILPLDASSPLYGFGVTGTLPEPLSREAFLKQVESALSASAIRYSGGANEIKKVAVCGGSGSFLISKAMGSGADAYVTADIKYHDFFVPDSFLLVDAGHYETEAPAIGRMCEKLSAAFPDIEVLPTRINTNPMRGFRP